jgi:hypothetical protein
MMANSKWKEYTEKLIMMDGLDELRVITVRQLAHMMSEAFYDGRHEVLEMNIAAGHETCTVRQAIEQTSEGPF